MIPRVSFSLFDEPEALSSARSRFYYRAFVNRFLVEQNDDSNAAYLAALDLAREIKPQERLKRRKNELPTPKF